MRFWQFWSLYPYLIYTTFGDKKQDCWLQTEKSTRFLSSILWVPVRSISIRLPEYLIDKLKEQANEISIPY